MHTEEEAKKKWCPMVRIQTSVPPYQVGINRGYDYESDHGTVASGSLCIASDCMMWRWGTSTEHKVMLIKEYREEMQCSLMEAKDYIQNNSGLIEKSNKGYCGLAGK